MLAMVLMVTPLLGKDRPNIVFIFSDDHTWQTISAYGHPLSEVVPTPNIDRIADEGVRFDRCLVTNSICAPSRAVVLTGKYSHLNGQLNNFVTFDGEQMTFPKLLQQAGYETAIVGKWHLKSVPTGFDHHEVMRGQGHYYDPTLQHGCGRGPLVEVAQASRFDPALYVDVPIQGDSRSVPAGVAAPG
jgi:arylsulfatase A-like enzyme